MSRRNTESEAAVAVNSNALPAVSESIAATRSVLKKKGGKQAAKSKGASPDALYADAGSTGSALVSIATSESLARHAQLRALEKACRDADSRFASYDVLANLGEVKTMGNLLESICDGAVAMVTILDPKRAPDFPKKTGIEWKDPLAYALDTIPILEKGNAAERAMAANIRKVANQFVAANKHTRQAQTGNTEARDAVTQSRLGLRSYILDCKKFVLGSTPSTHPARKHIKRKRAPKGTSQGASQSTQESSDSTPVVSDQPTPVVQTLKVVE